MIDFRPYNLIIPIPTIENKVGGGISAVRARFNEFGIQEDEYMIAIGLKNATEVRESMQMAEGLGLVYETTTARSEDFTILAKEGIWWPVAWLVYDDGKSWFIADVEAPV